MHITVIMRIPTEQWIALYVHKVTEMRKSHSLHTPLISTRGFTSNVLLWTLTSGWLVAAWSDCTVSDSKHWIARVAEVICIQSCRRNLPHHLPQPMLEWHWFECTQLFLYYSFNLLIFQMVWRKYVKRLKYCQEALRAREKIWTNARKWLLCCQNARRELLTFL